MKTSRTVLLLSPPGPPGCSAFLYDSVKAGKLRIIAGGCSVDTGRAMRLK